MSRFFFGILALIALLIAIVVVAPGLIPVSAYKGQIENAASASLGRQVTIGEGLRFKLVPQTAFHVTDLEIANPDGFTGPYLAHVKEADIGVKLLPLLNKNVEIERFILTEPDMKLERAKDGAVNWNLAAGEAKEAAESTGAETSVGDIKLGDVRIVNGKATFADATAGKTYTMGDINLAVRLASLAEPLEADGTLTFEGAPSKVDIVLTSLRKMLDKEPANLKLDMTLGDSSASGDLVVDTKDTLSYSGPVTLNAPNLPQFAALMGAPLADAPGFDTLAVEGTATGGDTFLKLANAKINFDKIDATGSLALNWAGARPKATGALAAGTLDLRPYLPPPSDSASGFPAWSEDKLDLTSLRNIDADIDMTANEIYLNDMKFGASQLKLTINDGRMVADIPELGLYGGGGSGQLVVNAKNATPTFAGKFDLGSVEAQPFVKDVMKNDRLLGLGGFKLDFSANGSSQAAIMRSLDGSGRFDIADGAIKGINLAKLARSVAEIQQGGLNPTAITSAIATAQKPDEQTDFSELLSQFSITDGLVNAPTISLAGPFVTMTG
ncbi:MAG TPA: AsmA family protein, partial [Amphiplicatus sp.]|nr:AsmA family protein [Amphiplicatus sp.]